MKVEDTLMLTLMDIIHLQAGAFSGLDNNITNTFDTPTARFQEGVCVWGGGAHTCACMHVLCVYIIYISVYATQSTSLKFYFRFHIYRQ